MKNSGKFQNSMRAVTINSEFSLPGLTTTNKLLPDSSEYSKWAWSLRKVGVV